MKLAACFHDLAMLAERLERMREAPLQAPRALVWLRDAIEFVIEQQERSPVRLDAWDRFQARRASGKAGLN